MMSPSMASSPVRPGVASQLREQREALGLTLRQVAAGADVSLSSVKRLESTGQGARTLRRVQAYLNLARAAKGSDSAGDVVAGDEFLALDFARPRASAALPPGFQIARVLSDRASLYFRPGEDILIDTNIREPLAAQPMALYVIGEGSRFGHVGMFGKVLRLVRMDGSQAFVDLLPGSFVILGRIVDALRNQEGSPFGTA